MSTEPTPTPPDLSAVIIRALNEALQSNLNRMRLVDDMSRVNLRRACAELIAARQWAEGKGESK
jgi:hypothetical protein